MDQTTFDSLSRDDLERIKFVLDGNGNVCVRVKVEGVSGSGHVIQDATTTFAQRDNLKFTGAVVVTDSSPDTTVVDIDADPTGTASSTMSSHVSDTNPHSQYALESDFSFHVSAPDPHPQYETSAESQAKVDARLSAANATDLTDGGDTSLHYHSSDRNRANHTGDAVSDFSINDTNGAVPVRESILNVMTSGVESGCTVTLPTSTTFSISSGFLKFVDTSTTPHTYSSVAFAGVTGVTNSHVSTSPQTYLYVNSSGTVTQRTTDPTVQLTNDEVLIAVIANASGSQIAFSYRNFVVNSAGVTLQEIGRVLGAVNVANKIKISANGANLNVNRSAGEIFRIGANYGTSARFANTLSINAGTPVNFSHIFRDGSGSWKFSTVTTALDTAHYDDGTGGTNNPTATIASNRYQIFRFYQAGNQNMIVAYGQAIYNSLANAEAAIGTESVDLSPLLNSQSLIGYVICKGNVTVLNVTTDTKFINVSTSASSPTGSTTATFQQIYENSTQPQVTTNSTQGAVQFKR